MAANGTVSRVVVSGNRVLSPFRTFLHRLSLEIEEEQFSSMKFMLEDDVIPLGILENCHKPRDLFSCMLQKCLLGEENLDLLEELLTLVHRSDLAERVRVFRKSISSHDVVDAPREQMSRELPAMGKAMVCFMLSCNTDKKAALERLKIGISAALRIKGREISFVRREEETDNWFSFILQIPKKEEVLNTLRNDALQNQDWLGQCGIQAVKINGDASYICLVQPLALTSPPTTSTFAQARNSRLCQEASGTDLKCTGFVDKHNLDLIVVVERILDPKFHRRLKTQLAHLVEMICARDYYFRLALVWYDDHTQHHVPNAEVRWFTKEKDAMKSQIHYLDESRRAGLTNGLADGLALARDLAMNNDGDDLKCRNDANKVCILLPSLTERTSLDAYNCSHGHDVMKICRQLAENSVTLYTVGISHPTIASHLGRNLVADFFAGISLKTGGRYIQTPNIKQIPGIIMCAIKEHVSLERLIGTAHDIVVPEVNRKYRDINVEELTEKLTAALNERSCRANLMLRNGVNIPPESELALKLSYDEDLESARITFAQGVNRMQQAVAATAGIPVDVNMEEMTTELARVTISNNHDITNDLSERLVRKVGHRTIFCTPS